MPTFTKKIKIQIGHRRTLSGYNIEYLMSYIEVLIL